MSVLNIVLLWLQVTELIHHGEPEGVLQVLAVKGGLHVGYLQPLLHLHRVVVLVDLGVDVVEAVDALAVHAPGHVWPRGHVVHVQVGLELLADRVLDLAGLGAELHVAGLRHHHQLEGVEGEVRGGVLHSAGPGARPLLVQLPEPQLAILCKVRRLNRRNLL